MIKLCKMTSPNIDKGLRVREDGRGLLGRHKIAIARHFQVTDSVEL